MQETQAVKKYFEQNPNLFNELGFSWDSEKNINDSLIQDLVEFKYLNKQKSLILKIGFFPASNNLNGAFTTALINKLENATSANVLDVYEYIKIHKIETKIKFLYKEGQKVDISTFTGDFIRELKLLLAGPLKNIVEGHSWETTPIDWQGYK